MALGDVIARLAVNLTMDTAAFEAGADAAEKRLARTASNIDKLGQKMRGVGEKLTLSFTAPFAALVALADDARGLKNASQLAGETFEGFQRGAAAAKTIGVDYEKFGDILKDTREKLGDFAANGGGELADFFENVAPKVGVTIDMFKDLTGSQALQLYYDSLVKANIPQQQMVFYMESIADEGSALIPILRDNGKAMKELGGNAAIISEDDAKSLEDYTTAQTALSNAFLKLKVAIAKTGIVDLVTKMVDKFAGLIDWFAALPPGVQQVGVALGAFALALGPLLVALGTIVSAGSTVFAALASIGASMASTGTATGALTVAWAALRGALAALVAPLGVLAAPIAALTAAFILFREETVAALSKVFRTAVDTLGPKLTALFGNLGTLIDTLLVGFGKMANHPVTKFLGELIGKLIELGGTAVINSIAEAIDFVNALFDVIMKTTAAVKSAINGDWKSAWTLMGSTVADSVKTIIRAIGRLFPPLGLLIEMLERAGLIEKKAPVDPMVKGLQNAKALTAEQMLANLPSESGTSSTTNVNPAIPTKEKKKKTPKAPEMATEADQQRELDRLASEELNAKLALATDADERADISREILAAEKAERIAEVQANDKFTDAQKKAQMAYLERLYGADSSTGEIVVNNSLYAAKLNREIAEEQARQANDMLGRQADTLQSWADIAVSTKERARLEGEALTLQQQIQRNLLEQQIASGDIAKADADRARALLANQQQAERQRFDRSNMSPMERYKFDLQASVANINEAMEGIKVDGIDSLVNGLSGAIAGTQKLGAVFKGVAQSIIADLARIQLQKALVGGLSKVLGLAGGSSINGVSASSFSAGLGSEIQSWAADLKKIPGFATGTNYAPRGLALVGERGPELVNFSGGQRVYNNADTSQLLGGRGAQLQVVPSAYFDVVVREQAARVAVPAASAAGAQARASAGTDLARAQRRRIPGR
ncbi:MAG: hypothetical protein DI555_07880 [Novosphingobium pentaromativorans]|uniref:Uncharacterized protein n=1 Tax=Novosphingobium pentaromativorans TaxID=205844 RepID=A0A2W5NP37_9SPHN|nr:MAG: hypothetical protein DI555_07880 [Novosphingobium pentaromativorans]